MRTLEMCWLGFGRRGEDSESEDSGDSDLPASPTTTAPLRPSMIHWEVTPCLKLMSTVEQLCE